MYSIITNNYSTTNANNNALKHAKSKHHLALLDLAFFDLASLANS